MYSIEVWCGVLEGHVSGVKSGVLCRSSSVLLRTRDVVCWKLSQSHQQLYRCLAATVWAARHHSNMHNSLLLLAIWKNHASAPEPGDTDWNRHAGTCLSETSEDVDELKWHLIEIVSNQHSFIDRAIDQWRDYYVAHYVWPYHETVRMSVCLSVRLSVCLSRVISRKRSQIEP